MIFTAVCICVLVLTAGCSHSKTNRGYLFRADWAFEYNRTPWIGCPPDSGCSDESGDSCGKGKDANKGFRRHCGLTSNCTAKHPCCKTLGCGMWIDPSSPNSFAALNTPKACGLTPFCSPMKPCGLTPYCGKTPVQNPQLISVSGNSTQNGIPAIQNIQGISGGQILPTPLLQRNNGIIPNGIIPNSGNINGTPQNGTPQNGTMPRPATLAGPSGALISMGIVPGVSTITSGGLVAAVGVRTPSGMMTPAGVQLPNGTFNNAVVLRACGLTPNCNAARPCGMTPNCGGVVPLAAVSNNAVALASALSSPDAQSGGIVNAGGGTIPVGGNINGMLVNPISGQPVYGLSMNGIPQTGYPPIGYTPSGYSPKYPRFDGLGIGMTPEQYAALLGVNNTEETEEPEVPVDSPITKSQMPVPRFHPVPSKPVFQRSEGLPVNNKKTSAAADNRTQTTEENQSGMMQSASKEDLKRAYLEGMAAAMEEVENELEIQKEAQEQKRETEQMQARVLQQAKELQGRIAETADRHETVQVVSYSAPPAKTTPSAKTVPPAPPVATERPAKSAPSALSAPLAAVPVTQTKKQDTNVLAAAADYAGGKIMKGIGTVAALGKKNTSGSNEQLQQLNNAQQRILQQQSVLQHSRLKEPPKPSTISRTKVHLQDENEIMSAGYSEP